MTREEFIDQIAERAEAGTKACYSAEEMLCNECPYVSEKTKHLKCMDHLWYDILWLTDHRPVRHIQDS